MQNRFLILLVFLFSIKSHSAEYSNNDSVWTWQKTALYGAMGLSLIPLYFRDSSVQNSIKDNRLLHKIDFVEHFGDYKYTPIFLLGYLGGLALENQKLKESSLYTFQAILGGAVVAQSLKIILGRARPGEGKGSQHYRPFSFKDNFWSLPSGHSTIAFSIASSLSHYFDEQSYLPYVLYPLASIVALQRIASGEHWPTDVLLGSIIGILSGHFVVRLQKKRSKSHRLSIYPFLSQEHKGLILALDI